MFSNFDPTAGRKHQSRFVIPAAFAAALTLGSAGSPATVRELVEDFSTPHAAQGSSAVWNLARRALHVPFVLDKNQGQGGNPSDPPQENEVLDLGDGSDGAFVPGRYSLFDLDTSTPNEITLDPAKRYQFTEFDLDNAYTLKAIAGGPLILRVQGDATIAGGIDISGKNGQSAAMGSGLRTGGGSTAGGGSGGNGANVGVTPSSAGTGAVIGAGGGGGANASAGSAPGGSGAGHFNSGTAGDFSGPPGGSAYGDNYITILRGGSGGGGGGAQSTQGSSGAGGGGGGGALAFYVGGDITINASGDIQANGGAGGGVTGVLAGPGGGGSGGALRFLIGGLYTNDTQVRALAGAGGTASFGTGSNGRIFVGNRSGTVLGQGSGAENPPPAASPFGQTFYSLAPVQTITLPYDTGNSRPNYISLQAEMNTPGSSTATVEVAGSDDAFAKDDTGWGPLSAPERLANKRYYRFRMRMTAGSRSASPQITRLSVRFEERVQNEFSFGWKGCGSVSPRSGGQGGAGFGALLLLLAVLPFLRRWTWIGRAFV